MSFWSAKDRKNKLALFIFVALSFVFVKNSCQPQTQHSKSHPYVQLQHEWYRVWTNEIGLSWRSHDHAQAVYVSTIHVAVTVADAVADADETYGAYAAAAAGNETFDKTNVNIHRISNRCNDADYNMNDNNLMYGP